MKRHAAHSTSRVIPSSISVNGLATPQHPERGLHPTVSLNDAWEADRHIFHWMVGGQPAGSAKSAECAEDRPCLLSSPRILSVTSADAWALPPLWMCSTSPAAIQSQKKLLCATDFEMIPFSRVATGQLRHATTAPLVIMSFHPGLWIVRCLRHRDELPTSPAL